MDTTCVFCFGILVLISNCWFALSSSKSFFNLTTDEYALIAFKNSIISNPNPILLKNWSTETPICRWIGVSCGTKHHRVTALNVSGFELVGTIPPHLGNLTFLRSLDISFNNFTGILPSDLSKLRRLEKINVGANKLTGEIPSWFGALSQLRRMNLYNNRFSGRIPPSLFNISRLQTLRLGYNILSGNIPQKIGNFSSLEILSLAGNHFTGSIPTSIFNISSLIEINLGQNRLSGKLPNNMCSNTPKLISFNVSRNQLYGEIPPNIGKCRELQFLQLQSNHFNCNIPSEIGSLIMLEGLYIWLNEFKGSMPKQVGNLTSLMVINFQSNNLTGELPEEIGNLASLEVFLAYGNSLSGSVPPSIFNISTLNVLELARNEFSGSLPSNKELSLPNLQHLYLHSNRLSGPIPSYITNASLLIRLEMSNNSFSGSMPNFGNLRLIETLRISTNSLTGGAESPTQELKFLSSLTNCRYLGTLDVSDNPLNGILPSSIGNFSTSLRDFEVNRCNIKGSIPLEIGNLSSLQDLDLSANQLTGNIPTTMGNMRRLQIIYLHENQLQGYIPIDLCQLTNLGDLYLSSNILTGPLPECFGELKSLRNMDLSSNKLNFTLPSTLWNLRDVVTLKLSSNYFSGQLSSQIEQLKVVNRIDLSSNQFSGNITDLIDGCQSLEILYLSNNKFGGSIPQSLGKVKGLIEIDFSSNNLSGMIPNSLEELRFLEYFNVSYNSLEGEIPNGGCFVNFTAQSFLHNSALCGATRFQVPPCQKINRGRSRSKNVARLLRYIVPVFISAVILAIIIIMLIRRRKQTKMPPPADTSVGNAWRIISYSELLRATTSFSETELLGRGSFGSVFKGTLSDGMNIAVKVINLQSDRANKSFATESRILSNIRHRNLVRIISSCTNMEFKALILEFMPNGSLEKWLYSENYCTDLLQWLNIAIDVALALEYLHHGHTFPVVHCDIKPSNVLLDEDMTARVADFGIAKLFEEGEDMIQTKTLATIGYAAPEYGSEGKVSTSVDVYSYGIMLLEMFTRKKPTDDMFNGEMSLKEWVSEALQVNAMNQVLAPALLSEEDVHFVAKEQCVVSVFELAMKCLANLPDERINMIEAAATLHKIKARVATGDTTKHQQHAISIT